MEQFLNKQYVMKPAFISILITLSFQAKCCPLCNSKTATQIRASLFGPDLYFNLLVSVLPFVICFGIVYLIYTGGRIRNIIPPENNRMV